MSTPILYLRDLQLSGTVDERTGMSRADPAGRHPTSPLTTVHIASQARSLKKTGRPHGGLLQGGLVQGRLSCGLWSGFSFVCALGLVGTGGTAGTAWCALPAPVCQSKADKQND